MSAPLRLLASVALATALGVGGYVYLSAGQSAVPASRFVLIDGSATSTAAMMGQVTLVNFWATSCTTCVAEMPDIVKTFNKYQAQGFRTLAVAMQYDPPNYVVNFARGRQLPFQVAIDNTGELARNWGGVQLTPTSFLVDRQGRIVKRYVGAPDFPELHRLIEQLLAKA